MQCKVYEYLLFLSKFTSDILLSISLILFDNKMKFSEVVCDPDRFITAPYNISGSKYITYIYPPAKNLKKVYAHRRHRYVQTKLGEAYVTHLRVNSPFM